VAFTAVTVIMALVVGLAFLFATAVGEVGLVDEAINMFETVAVDFTRVLEASHSDTVQARLAPAGAHDAADHLDEAIDHYERILADCERDTGVDADLRMIVYENLVPAYERAGCRECLVILKQSSAPANTSMRPSGTWAPTPTTQARSGPDERSPTLT